MKSNTPGKKRISDRTRMLLTLELAIILPAASLMAFSVWNLHKIQRDKQIEAAIQRDFSSVLRIAEKQIVHKGYDLLAPVRKEFPPCGSDVMGLKADLDRLLADHPELLFAVFYDKEDNQLAWRARHNHDSDPVFRKQLSDVVATTTSWVPTEAAELVHKLQ